MSIGNQPSVAALNQSLSSYAIQMRELMTQIANLNMSIAQLGAAGLEALPAPPNGTQYSSADAAAVIATAAIMNTVAAVYFGTATQATEYNFNNALCGLWAGQ